MADQSCDAFISVLIFSGGTTSGMISPAYVSAEQALRLAATKQGTGSSALPRADRRTLHQKSIFSNENFSMWISELRFTDSGKSRSHHAHEMASRTNQSVAGSISLPGRRRTKARHNA